MRNCGSCVHWKISEINGNGKEVLSKMGEHGYGCCLKGENFVFFGASKLCVRGVYQQADKSILERRERALLMARKRLEGWANGGC